MARNGLARHRTKLGLEVSPAPSIEEHRTGVSDLKGGITLANFVTETLPEYLSSALSVLPPHSPYYSRIQSRANRASNPIKRAALIASFVRAPCR
jgi:hypothetical protein